MALIQGCARDIYVPPASPVPLETTRIPPAGATSFRAEGSLNMALTGPGLATGGVGARRGLTERLSVSADTSFMHVTGISQADVHSNIYAARLGAQLDLAMQNLAFTGGLGGGYAPAVGGFGSIDLGLVSSIENCVLVPFGAGRVFASVPIKAKPVDVIVQGEDAGGSGPPVTRTYMAENTFGITVESGIKIPLDRQCESRAGLLLGVGVTLLGDGDNSELFTNVGLAVEVTRF